MVVCISAAELSTVMPPDSSCLLFRIVGREVRRDAVPGLSVITGAEEELRSDINRALFIRTHMDGRVPVETQLALAVVGLRFDVACIQRLAVDSPNFSALVFCIGIVGVSGVGEGPKAIAAVEVFPTAVAD